MAKKSLGLLTDLTTMQVFAHLLDTFKQWIITAHMFTGPIRASSIARGSLFASNGAYLKAA